MKLVHHAERCPNNPRLLAFVAWWSEHGPFPITIVRGDTTDAQQWDLYQQGRTKPGKVVTNAPSAEKSAHGHSGAFDAHPVRELFASGGVKSIYLGDEDDHVVREEALRRLNAFADLVEEHGLESGRDFEDLKDLPHAQDPDWESRPLNPPKEAP